MPAFGVRHVAMMLVAMAAAGPAGARDVAVQPPARETFSSPGGGYRFELAITQPGASGFATGTLRHAGNRDFVLDWQRVLKQPVRPRYALVADDGTVALFARWENVKSGIAIELIDPRGRTVASLGFDDIVRASGIPATEIVHRAKHAVWIDGLPQLVGRTAQVGVAGRTLSLDLSDGSLRVLRR